MKKLIFLFVAILSISMTYAYNVSGVAINSENGNPLSNFDILLIYESGGIAGEVATASDGSFIISDIDNGIYSLEFYTYPDPIIINGDYFMGTTSNDPVEVNGGDVTGVQFEIPPHHPNYTLTGVLYDAVTNDTINIQNFQVQAKMKYLIEFFIDYETENGMYILENLPDWIYEFNLIDNDYYEGVYTDITIDPSGPDTVQMDFYLQPKMGASISGVLLDSITNQPIMQAGRTIKLQASNSLFTQTNDQGEFTFVNVPPGYYAGLKTTSEDTSYVNCSGSEISSFYVPAEGVDDVQLYQKKWISIHQLEADDNTFVLGETKTVKFSITNDDLGYGSIWGVNLIFPEGVSVLNNGPFYDAEGSDIIFSVLPDCSTASKKAWQGWHLVGIPPYAFGRGNLDLLNESAWANTTLSFADSAAMESVSIFYEIYYATHCNTIQPFSYGTILMVNESTTTQTSAFDLQKNNISVYPNPARAEANIIINLDKGRSGAIAIYDFSGKMVINLDPKTFKSGRTLTKVNTRNLDNGIYYYSFLSDDLKLTGKLVVSK